MSEKLPVHRRIVERLSKHNNPHFDSVSWPCDGLEYPSYRELCRHSRPVTQKLWFTDPCPEESHLLNNGRYSFITDNRGDLRSHCIPIIYSSVGANNNPGPWIKLKSF